jgi:hypothetical protein
MGGAWAEGQFRQAEEVLYGGGGMTDTSPFWTPIQSAGSAPIQLHLFKVWDWWVLAGWRSG